MFLGWRRMIIAVYIEGAASVDTVALNRKLSSGECVPALCCLIRRRADCRISFWGILSNASIQAARAVGIREGQGCSDYAWDAGVLLTLLLRIVYVLQGASPGDAV